MGLINENVNRGFGINEKLKSLSYVYNNAGEVIYQVDDEGNITYYEYDEIGRLESAYYTFISDKKETDFEERLDLGLFPEYEEVNGNGNNRDEASFMIPEVNIPGFDNGSFKSSLMEALRENEELFKLYYHIDNNGKWIVKQWDGATDFVIPLDVSYELKDEVEDVFSLIANKNTYLDTNQWMWMESFEYDENSNRISKANGWGKIDYTYNTENQILTAGDREYEHDLNGNLIVESIFDVEAVYTYNPNNRVKSIYSEISGFIGNGEWKLDAGIEYTYDPFGRRNSSVEYTEFIKNNGNHEKEWITETNIAFIYNGLGFNIISEVTDVNYDKPGNGNGWQGNSSQYTPVTEYIYGNGSIVSRTDFSDQGNSTHQDKVYYEQDILGSTILLTDDKGHAVETYSYDAYGVMYDGSFDRSDDYGYNGKRLEASTGLYNYGFRDYAPNLGRWTTIDPIRDADNWYVYVGNDPVNYVDLWGLEIWPEPNYPETQYTVEEIIEELNKTETGKDIVNRLEEKDTDIFVITREEARDKKTPEYVGGYSDRSDNIIVIIEPQNSDNVLTDSAINLAHEGDHIIVDSITGNTEKEQKYYGEAHALQTGLEVYNEFKDIYPEYWNPIQEIAERYGVEYIIDELIDDPNEFTKHLDYDEDFKYSEYCSNN